ncbi:unnamed protein product [Nesidiocoris tenuis]|uniref:Uncharacterized protein n=1 Tax=Nesidiocoris tenuis TaxID=355587 RepID=A0A6H5FYW9_9HEMI|nr:unnamed protein product [Nesidiocoris tenuis]
MSEITVSAPETARKTSKASFSVCARASCCDSSSGHAVNRYWKDSTGSHGLWGSTVTE